MELSKADEEITQPTKLKPSPTFWEAHRDRILTWTGVSTLVILLLYLVIIINAEQFAPFLESIGLKGLYNRQAGVYTDCSLAENRNARYCLPKESHADRDWRDLTLGKGTGKNKGAVFSLSGE